NPDRRAPGRAGFAPAGAPARLARPLLRGGFVDRGAPGGATAPGARTLPAAILHGRRGSSPPRGVPGRDQSGGAHGFGPLSRVPERSAGRKGRDRAAVRAGTRRDSGGTLRRG